YRAQRTGALIDVLLDAAGWTGPRDLDLGATFVPWWWLEETDAFQALGDLLASEGPPSVAYVAGDGTFIFRGCHHRLLRESSRQPQASFAASAAGECSPVDRYAIGGYGAGGQGGVAGWGAQRSRPAGGAGTWRGTAHWGMGRTSSTGSWTRRGARSPAGSPRTWPSAARSSGPRRRRSARARSTRRPPPARM